MRWLTKDEIKNAALSAETALDCSIEHWRQLSTATPVELKEGIENDLVGLSDRFCAMCQYYDTVSTYRCSKCPMKACGSGNGWAQARDALVEFEKIGFTECTVEANAWGVASKAMYDKLLSLKKPQLKNGDILDRYGNGKEPMIYLTMSGNDQRLVFIDGSYHGPASGFIDDAKAGKYKVLGNAFRDWKNAKVDE